MNLMKHYCLQGDEPFENNLSTSELKKMFEKLQNQPQILYEKESIMAFIYACLEALSKNENRLYELIKIQKTLIASIQLDDPTILFFHLEKILINIANDKKEGKNILTVRDALLLTLFTFIFIGDAYIDPKYIHSLQKAFVTAMLSVFKN